MTASERRNTIINYLQTKQDCDVNEIIDQFDVTPATIRRDLTFLENSGSISRTHGAVHLVKTPAVPGFLTRNTLFAEEKQAMARVAAPNGAIGRFCHAGLRHDRARSSD